MDINVVILAAGGSARLGKPKQLLKFAEKSLIAIAIEKALSIITNKTKIYVVLGAFYEEINKVVEHYDVNILENADWKIGLSSSVNLAVQNSKTAQGILFMLVDQPLVSVEYLKTMLSKFDSKIIVCSKFENGAGVPMLIPQYYFETLIAELHGDKGAGFLIHKYPQNIVYMDCPEAAFDIDTVEDELKLNLIQKYL